MKTTLMVALTLIIAYGALIGFSNSGAETALQGYWHKNRNVIASYAATERQVVFAGSSLTAALYFSGFDSCVYNMGLIGESALTGMDVVNGGPWMPGTVFVEINFPERESNATLIHSADGLLARHFPGFVYVPPITFLAQLAAGALQRSHAAPFAGTAGGPASLGVGGADRAREAELAIQRDVFETRLTEPVLKNKLVEFAIKIRKLQRNGVTVALIELPVHPELEETPRARQIREAFREAFPDLHMIRSAMLAQGLTIKTADGLHLTEEDSNGVLTNFRPELQAACEKRAP